MSKTSEKRTLLMGLAVAIIAAIVVLMTMPDGVARPPL